MVEDKRLNILLSAFSCEPGKGGEAGVGWNFAKNLAAQHNVWVLTREANRKIIEKETTRVPLENVVFIYYDLPAVLSNREKWLGEQAYYVIWQVFVLPTYRTMSKKIDFDLIHHITYNQYRSPSLGFFTRKPFILGPIGGAETVSSVFFQDLFFKGKLKELWRILGLDIYLFSLICKVTRNRKKIVYSSNRNLNKMTKYLGAHESQVIPSIAIDRDDFVGHERANCRLDRPFSIIYSGTAKDWKGLLILLRAVKRAFADGEDILVKLIGIRNDQENQRVTQWIDEYGLWGKVELIRFLPREKVIEELSNADICVYPAFRDSGSMSVLEACALGCTVVCFDAGGQDAFPDNILLKIPVSDDSYQANLNNLSDRLKWCFENPDEIKRIGDQARQHVFKNFTWQQKVSTFSKLYKELLSPVSGTTLSAGT